MSLSPASLLSRWKRFQLQSRRPFFTPDTSTRPLKSRRTFNALNGVAVRVSPEDLLLAPLQPHLWQHKPHDQVTSVLICGPASHLPSAPNQQRTQPQSPAALHYRLNPERSALGAVIRPRFTAPASSPVPLTGPV